MQFTDFLDIQHLATISTAAFIVFVFVSYTKTQLDRVYKMSTDLYAAIAGTIFMAALLYAQGTPVSVQWALLSIVNGFVIAYIAGRMNDHPIKLGAGSQGSKQKVAQSTQNEKKAAAGQ